MDLLPPNLKADMDELWPHQKQAIAQALTVLETQGAVVICDPTGAGKTREGGWLFRLAYNRIIARGGENMNSLIPVMISPPSVENNWYQILDKVGVPREIISQGQLSNTTKESTKRRLDLIEKTNLLGVDEAHNYYNWSSKRTKMLSNNLADSRILLTATPINRGFSDIIKLMNLLGTAELDGDTFRKIRMLEEKINDQNPRVREEARNAARKLVQRFMVRRTRDEIKQMVSKRPEEYKLGDRTANYPDYHCSEYQLNSEIDDNLVKMIEEKVEKILGLTRLREIKQSTIEKESGISEKSYLKRRLNSSSGLSRWQVWNTLDSSKAALFEHVYGTQVAEEKFGVKTGKGQTESKGMVNILRKIELPEWGLSEDLVNSPETPVWITDPRKFGEARDKEIENYEKIVEYSLRMTDNRQDAKLDTIRDSIETGGKPLGFDSSIITLSLMKELLEKEGFEVYLFTGTDGKTKKMKVKTAEEKFGLGSEDRPIVGLLSDSMSEGINLQGSSILIHLTRPSTIKNAEQRAGRVDRMDSEFDEITVQFPERDRITSKKKAHLLERVRLVKDLIGSNIKLPDDSEFQDYREVGEDEIDLSTDELNDKMFSNRDGLLDAFHDIRNLVGEDGLVSDETYELMRTSEARVVSCVGLVRSQTPWCFAVIQTNKNWAPQWIFLDWRRREATAGRGITIQSDEICSSLRTLLKESDDITPSNHSDRWLGKYLDFLSKNEFEMLSIRKKHLLHQFSSVLNSWQNQFGHQSEIGKPLGDLRRAATGKSGDFLDMRELATQWNSFVRDYRDKLDFNKSKSRKAKTDNELLLKQNPPEDMEGFIQQFSKIPHSEEFDTRVVAFIAGIPDHED
jgi:superfamily II DNA or RNA helicase